MQRQRLTILSYIGMGIHVDLHVEGCICESGMDVTSANIGVTWLYVSDRYGGTCTARVCS